MIVAFSTNNSFFFPLFSEECDYESVTGDDELKNCVTRNNQYADGKISIDGLDLKNISQYKFTTDFFNINFKPNNLYDATAGTYRALINGLFLFIKPFTPGLHEIKYSIIQIKPTHDNDYAAEITYKINIISK